MNRGMEQSINELINLLQIWEEEMLTPSYNPIPTLIKLCELFETELKNYLKTDPDPFEDRLPYPISQTCVLGQMYNILILKSSLINKVMMDYLKEHHWPRQTKDNYNLNVAACRLIINFIPGLKPFVALESKIIQRLFTWAENTSEPLQTYATRLLASFMDSAANFKEANNKLVPIIMDRIHLYYNQFCEENDINQTTQLNENMNIYQPNDETEPTSPKKKKREENGICGDSNSSFTGFNTSNWIQIYPLTLTTKLVYCLKYLAETGEYQEFSSHAYKKNALNIVMKLINSSKKQNDYLTFEALKYLATLLCFKKIATEFIDSQGLQKLLRIRKSSILSTGILICFYNLSFCEETMERICRLPEYVLVDLVKCALWILESSYGSSRCHAIIFFSFGFHFRVIQKIFDNHNGLRILFNVVSTMQILSSEDSTYSSLTEDAKCSSRQIIRHFCAGLKHYFELHLHIKAQEIRKAKKRESDSLISSTIVHNSFSVPAYKSTKKCHAKVQEDIDLLLNVRSPERNWAPIDQFLKLDGLSLLLKIIRLAQKFNFSRNYGCKVVKDTLEVLNICAILPKVQLALCEIPSPKATVYNQNNTFIVEENDPQSKNDKAGLNIIIKAAGDKEDANIQKAALSVIITCVCAPILRKTESIACDLSKKRTPRAHDKAVIEKIWDCFRKHNGIMVLLTLMTIKTPITDVDAIRGLASRALAGLVRSESVLQIIRKLPLFNSGQLQSLMKNPVLQEKRQEHLIFQTYALKLMELVSGNKKSNVVDIEASLKNINQANVVAQTKIHFNEQQLLILVHQHLMEKGLFTTAESLVKEANLNIAEKKSTPSTYISHCCNQWIEGRISPMSSTLTIQNQKSELANSSNGPSGAGFNTRELNSTPIRLNVNRSSENHPKLVPEQELESPMSKLVHKKIDQNLTLLPDNNTNSKVSLESIVTEYLTYQHASCKSPMVTCPTFDLFVLHKCPDPKPRNSMLTNFGTRFSKNIHSRKLNQRLIHSRFYPACHFQLNISDEEESFTCCEFLSQNRVAIGTYNGEIKVINLFTSQEEVSFSAHDSCIIDLQCSNDEKILLSSAIWQMPSTSVWSITENKFNIKYRLDEEYCTFSNYDQNKILGTKAEIATIYDLETSKRILTLVPTQSNRYIRNRAAFDAKNQLVLSDGVLWDAIAGKQIHKFDKLNQCMSGIFHPNGLEIISNTEVWDMRTYQLLQIVPSLDQCNVTFSKSGEGMYLHNNYQKIKNSTQTSFKTLDPNDYSNIATVDVKKFIYHIACNSSDTQIAIVENKGLFGHIDESIVRIYDVGRTGNKDEIEREDN